MFRSRRSTPSVARKPCGSVSRRLTLSSSVRSSHWVAAVWAALTVRLKTNRARPHIRSARIGLRLYGIADEPTCSDSNGSSTSCR